MIKCSEKYLLFFGLIFFLSSCAQISSPSGGAKDVDAPQLDSLRTFPYNGSVNFSGTEIRLKFDEYIRVNNPRQQVLISPKPVNSPEYIQKGQSFIIRFKEKLKENTTYTLSFGNSVADITEGNVARGLNYVFSTGPVLDSFSVSGIIKDAYTMQTCSGWMVLLYATFSDSVIFNSDPDYLGVTQEDGSFQVRHLREGDYKLFALKDQNNNLRYDPGTDEIAFLSDLLNVNAQQSSITGLKLASFKEPPAKTFLKKSILLPPGHLVLSYSSEQEFLDVQVQLSGFEDSLFSSNNWFFKSMVNDSLELWVPPVSGNSFSVIVQRNGTTDTVSLYNEKRQLERAMNSKLAFVASPSSSHHPKESLRFRLADPINEIDKRKIHLLLDSVASDFELVKGRNDLQLITSFEKHSGKKVQVLFLPGAVRDVYGRSNDTLRYSFKVLTIEQMGVLLVKTEISNVQPYFFELVNSRGQVVAGINSKESFEWKLTDLLPGDYTIRAIIDQNENTKWDAGDILLKRQPEEMIYFGKPITIRANWDVEITWKL